MGTVIPISIAVFFLLYFLTDVAGLSPTLAGAVLLVGRAWDAINDPLIGWLSDRTRSRWGRRYPWIALGSIPLAFCCALQWLVPSLSSQLGLFLYYSLVSLIAYAAFSAVQLPFAALVVDLTPDDDERTSLMGFKSGFNIVGSLLGLVLAQIVFAQIPDIRQQYLTLGWLTALIILITIPLCIWGTYDSAHTRAGIRPAPNPKIASGAKQSPSAGHTRRVIDPRAMNPKSKILPHIPHLLALFTRPFLWLLGLYLCAWVGIQIAAAMLPYFVSNWMQLPEQHFTQMAMTVQGTAVLSLPLWLSLTQKTSKKRVYLIGAPIAWMGLLGLSWLQPGQWVWMYGLAIAVGLGLAPFYLVPLAMLPDVIDYDTAQTGLRREGLYFSFLVFFQKVGLAIALFLVGRCLDIAGFVNGATSQSAAALLTIRLLMGCLPAVFMVGGVYCAWQYPLSRQVLLQKPPL